MSKSRDFLDEVYYALEESVKLQSHYATLLNESDGGKRMRFNDAIDWIQRLRELRKKENDKKPACS